MTEFNIRRVIVGRIYDTKTAVIICNVSRSPVLDRGNWHWDDTCLYRTTKGAFFIAGEGGPLSQWAQRVGQSGYCSGNGMRLVTEEEARELVETHSTPDTYAETFGQPEEG